MQILSWNVNGLRSVLKKGFPGILDSTPWDILCLQETRLGKNGAGDLPDLGPHVCFHNGERAGYAGTAILSKVPPVRFFPLDGNAALGYEGRAIVAEFESFFLVSVYSPNSQNELRRLDYRCSVWEPAFREALIELDRQKPVIAGGDFNVAHEEIDLARPKDNRRNAGFTDEERLCFRHLLEAGFVDTFRAHHPGEPGHYSWWSFRGGARERNVGWRIDYFLCSERLQKKALRAAILPQIPGSDHCPVSLTLE